MPVENSRGPERRAEPRLPANGAVSLSLNGSVLGAVPGHLVDLARSGFRAEHRSPSLLPGHIVEFRFGGVSGRARVIWTRILGERVESGFMILPEEGARPAARE